MHGAGGELKVEGGRKWKKKIEKTTIYLISNFVFHLKWYSFDIIFYGHKL